MRGYLASFVSRQIAGSRLSLCFGISWEGYMRQSVSRFILLMICVVLYCGTASAQFSSAISGTVTDNTGAIVPGAKVELTNESTGVTSTTESNADGDYRFSALGPGSYQVAGSLTGFASFTVAHIDLTAQSVR